MRANLIFRPALAMRRAPSVPTIRRSPCSSRPPSSCVVPKRSYSINKQSSSLSSASSRTTLDNISLPTKLRLEPKISLSGMNVPRRYLVTAAAAPASRATPSSSDCSHVALGSLPLGVTDFASIHPEADTYFDRSEYLVHLEKRGPIVRGLRPKGFGKSLFLSSLAMLHDCSTSDADFLAAFKGTAIARAVERGEVQRGRFIVLRLDLSKVDWTGPPDDVRASLQRHINDRIGEVWFTYAARLGPRPLGETDPIKAFRRLLERVEKTSVKVYLLVDAYDAVSFDVMGRLHRDERESGTITLLHSLFAAFLEHRGPSGIGRIFIAGVTPLAIPLPSKSDTIDDVSLDKDFDRIFGLTEDDIARALRLVNPKESVVQMHLDLVRRKLNRYRPTPTSQAILYNATAALDYLDKVKSGVLRSDKHTSLISMDLVPGLLDQFAGSRAGRRVLETVLANGEIAFTREEISQDYDLPQLYTTAEELRGDAAESLLKSLLLHLGGLTFAQTDPCKTLIAPSEEVINRMVGAILERYCLQKSQLFDAVDLLVAKDDPGLLLRLLEGTMASTVPVGDGHLASDMARQLRVIARAATHPAHRLEPGGSGATVLIKHEKKTFVFCFHALDENAIDWNALAKLPGLPQTKGKLTHEDILIRLQDDIVLSAHLNNSQQTVAQLLQDLAKNPPANLNEEIGECNNVVAFMVVTVAARRCLYSRLL